MPLLRRRTAVPQSRLIPLLAKAMRVPALPRQGPLFDPPDHAEVLAITHLFELPRDLAVPDGKAAALFEPRADAFVDWPDEVRAAFVDRPRFGGHVDG